MGDFESNGRLNYVFQTNVIAHNQQMVRDAFLQGMSSMASTVSVVATDGRAGRQGVTVSAMCSVSADPPMLLVCIHHQSRTVSAICENSVFCVNVLSEGQRPISDIFAGQLSAEEDQRFSAVDWSAGETGAPRFAGALAAFDCRVEEIHRAGTHYIFIGRVEQTHLDDGRPLVYGNRNYCTVSGWSYDDAT